MEGQRARRRALAVVGLIGLVAVVAIAAAGHAPPGGSSRPSAPAPRLLQDYVATLALLIMPIGFVLLVWAMLLKRVYANVPLKQPQAYPFQIRPRPLLWVAVFLAGIVLAMRLGDPNPDPPAATSSPVSIPTVTTVAEPPRNRYEPQFRWLPMIVVGALVLGIGGTMGVLALRRQRELLEAIPVQTTLAEVLGLTLDDLRREPDPRKAVIGAYRRMVETLAARGVPRRESEAPLEYLERVLAVVSGHSPKRLTGLFARARYSPHEIDEGMKEQAIEALTGLRAELEAGR